VATKQVALLPTNTQIGGLFNFHFLLVKVIFDFTASDLYRGAYTLNIAYATFLALEICVCCVMACITLIKKTIPTFSLSLFFFGIVEMCCLTVKGVINIMGANGLFYGLFYIQHRKNTSIDG
jgi:hypothetical protein